MNTINEVEVAVAVASAAWQAVWDASNALAELERVAVAASEEVDRLAAARVAMRSETGGQH